MAFNVRVTDDAVPNLIRQAYLAGGQYQWVREGLMNALEADASWVKFGIEQSGFESKGVRRRYIADNGIGMNEDQIDIFLTSFGSGGKEIADHGNFGQGFKASCYEWNPYGIIAVSWTEETPEGTLIWIYRDQSDPDVPGIWKLKNFTQQSVDDEGNLISENDEHKIAPAKDVLSSIGVDAERLKFPEIEQSGHGTVFLFLGDSQTSDTVEGDPARGEGKSKRDIVRYINRRFLNLPDKVKVLVENEEKLAQNPDRRDTKDASVTGPGGTRIGLHSRRAKGMAKFVPPGSRSGEVAITRNTVVEWFLTPENEKPISGDDGPGRPVIALQYGNEAYEIKDTLAAYRQFGIMDSIRDRVWLIIKPPQFDGDSPAEWGVVPQGSRGALISGNGEPLPWEEFQDSFYKVMPTALQEAMRKADATESVEGNEKRRERMKRVLSRVQTRFRPKSIVESQIGDISGEDTSSRTGESRQLGGKSIAAEPSRQSIDKKSKETGGNGTISLIRKAPTGELKGKEKIKSDGLPGIKWDENFPEGKEQLSAARFEPKEKFYQENGAVGEGVIHLNLNFPLFKSEFEHWTTQYSQAGQQKVIEIVKSIYEDEIVAKILHSTRLMSTTIAERADGTLVKIDKSVIQNWQTPESLTMSLLGLVGVETRIKSELSRNFSAGKEEPGSVGGN